MKKEFVWLVCLALALLLSGCRESSAKAETPDGRSDNASADTQSADTHGAITAEEIGRDLPPMVRIGGTLYLDTGRKSTVTARCGVMDGTVTSCVDRTEQPTQDDQSNFGTGYGYQFGPQAGTVELCINGDWWVFAQAEA